MDTLVSETSSTSTATQLPLVAPEVQGAQPKPPESRSNRNLSPLDAAFERAKANRVKQETKSPEGVKPVEGLKPESTQTGTAENKADETLSTNGDYIEALRIGDKDVPVSDLFNDKMEFEVFANGEYKPVNGAKLLTMASIGFAATKTVENAKDVVRKADETIRETKAQYEQKLGQEVNQGVANYLNDLLAKAQSGTNPGTGKPFATQAERTGAVALAQKMVDLNANGAESGKALTLEDIEKRWEAKLNEKLGQSEKQKAEIQRQEVLAQISTNAESSLQKATEPLMQFFTEEDGKTVDQEQFNDFKDIIRRKADKLWEEAGKPLDPKKSQEFVIKAAEATLNKWKSRFKTSEVKPKQPPVGGTGAGLPASLAPKQKFANKHDALDAKLKGLMQTLKRA